MPGWKLLPLLTRSFANRDKDVRSRKRTRVERRETTTRWNTTKRTKVWIVIFFGLVPRWWSRARVPFRNSALRCFVPRFIRMKRRITRVSRRSGPFDSTKRKIYMEQLRDTNDDRSISMILSSTRDISRRYAIAVLLGFRKRSSIDRFLASTRLAIRFVVPWNAIDVDHRDPILDLGSLRSMVEAARHHQDEIR